MIESVILGAVLVAPGFLAAIFMLLLMLIIDTEDKHDDKEQ